jgi:hypothetical protein
MAKATSTTQLDWSEVDMDTLPESAAEAYDAYKAARKAAAEAKAEFELAFTKAARKAKKLPDSKKLLFGYNFGKLSIAVTDNVEEPAKASAKKKFSL